MKAKKIYPYELKKQVVEEYMEGNSASELGEKYDVDRRRVHDWVKRVKAGGFQALVDSRGIKSKGKRKKEEESLQEKYEKLQLENMYLKKLLDLKRG
ncbi:helix-turn-helix domain-containing protein [Bacillus sp. FJAT-49736]|uniref:helix-turn-helix domain-containing protein n=1 Tax=Bacillus sp. FJAT-49736 TaxID=2833582 RepID=UPI001BC91FB7|nr:helix-turn-helix domain-containing protein [Bacillus sp. FJAT-49736]MBS4171887.1 helix-turn-helix domain-containing protein [Bacillus sp. FJAT-49736]MBS4174061.1 helix-turn-helix domain-containing protein [Bacillus sp. FJAT-49736]MBS4174238.1 helix-turn-helix domain-containing protein [Bacillus sp. FJAT-49736]